MVIMDGMGFVGLTFLLAGGCGQEAVAGRWYPLRAGTGLEFVAAVHPHKSVSLTILAFMGFQSLDPSLMFLVNSVREGHSLDPVVFPLSFKEGPH